MNINRGEAVAEAPEYNPTLEPHSWSVGSTLLHSKSILPSTRLLRRTHRDMTGSAVHSSATAPLYKSQEFQPCRALVIELYRILDTWISKWPAILGLRDRLLKSRFRFWCHSFALYLFGSRLLRRLKLILLSAAPLVYESQQIEWNQFWPILF